MYSYLHRYIYKYIYIYTYIHSYIHNDPFYQHQYNQTGVNGIILVYFFALNKEYYTSCGCSCR